MNKELITMFFNIVIFLPFIIFLIYAALKYGGTGLQKMQNGKFIRLLERVPISKDNSIMLVKMGDKAFIVTSTSKNIEIVRELTKEEELQFEESKAASVTQYKSLKDLYTNFISKGR